MADLAVLGLQIESSPAVKLAADLDKATASAQKMEQGVTKAGQSASAAANQMGNAGRSTSAFAASLANIERLLTSMDGKIDRFGGANARAVASIRSLTQATEETTRAQVAGVAAVERMTAALEKQGRVPAPRQTPAPRTPGSPLPPRDNDNMPASDNDNSARARRQNLTYQLFDIGTSLSGGMNPALIAAQQGPQIAQAYMGQGGLNQALKDTATLAGTAARALAPIGIVVGAGALAVADLRSEIEKNTGVAVTYGETMKAVFQVTANYIVEFLQPAIDWIAPYFQKAWGFVEQVTREAFNGVVQAVNAAAILVRGAWQVTVPFLTQVGKLAANGFVAAFNEIPKSITAVLNQIITQVNGFIQSLPDPIKRFLGIDGATAIPSLDPNAGQFALPFNEASLNEGRAAMDKVYADTAAALAKNDQWNPLDRFKKDVQEQAVFNHLEAEAEKKTKGRTKAEREKKQALDETTKAMLRQIEAQKELNADLMFEGQQMNRSEAEQRIASRLRGTGYGMDSQQANYMRSLDMVEANRESAKSFLSAIAQGIRESDGKGIAQSILSKLQDALNREVDAALDSLFDTLVRTLFKAPSAPFVPNTTGGQFFGALGGGVGAANDNGVMANAMRSFASAGQSLPGLASAAKSMASGQGGLTATEVSNLTSYARQAAIARNIDPDIALRVMRSEGLKEGIWQSNITKGSMLKENGREASYGPLQFYKGGMGADFTRDTGLDFRDKANSTQMIDYGLNNAAKNGWGAWYGAKAAGIGNREGLSGAITQPIGQLSKAAAQASETVSGMAKNAAVAGEGLGGLGGGLSQLGQMLSGVGGGAGGSGWFSGLISKFGSVGGATGWMNSISPLATSFVAGGGVGLFAEGGVADEPSIFGEAGPEAAVPLTRNRKIPVEMKGGRGRAPAPRVIINNNNGSSVRADTRENEQGGYDINVAVDRAAAQSMAKPGSRLNRQTRATFGMKNKVLQR